MRFTEAVGINEHARLRQARSSRLRLCGVLLCIFSSAVIITGDVFQLWNLGDPDVNGFAIYLSFFLLYAGWVLIEGRKTPVIYLRRFGLTAANKTISDAIKAGLGSAYRVVTLDDLEIRPPPPPRIQMILSVVAPFVIAFLFIGIAAYVIEDRSGRLGLLDRALASFSASLTSILIMWTIGGCGITASIHLWRVLRRSRFDAVSTRDVDKVARRVSKLSSWLRGPRLMDSQVTVIRVADSQWKSMVTSLFEHTRNVIIDVSVPTSNLLWEVQQVSLSRFGQCVVVGNRDLVLGWLNTTSHSDNRADLYEETKSLLIDQEILLYDPADTLTWQTNLRRALDNVADFPRSASVWKSTTSELTTLLLYGSVWIGWLYVVIWIEPIFEPIKDLAKSLAR